MSGPVSSSKVAFVDTGTEDISGVLTADDAQIGDEYISLTFNESESSEGEHSDDDEVDDNDEDDQEQSVSVYS